MGWTVTRRGRGGRLDDLSWGVEGVGRGKERGEGGRRVNNNTCHRVNKHEGAMRG